MIEHTTKPQILCGPDGTPQFVVLPLSEYPEFLPAPEERPDEKVLLPNKVVKLAVVEGKGIVRAWREYKGLTQAELAKKMEITQPAMAQLERPGRVIRLNTRQRLAAALGIEPEQLRMVEED